MKSDEIISDLRELMTRDILYRKDIESLLHKSEERYRKLFEASRDAIYFSSANGRFTDFNQAALDLFGYNRSEMLQLNVLSIYADPADRERFQGEIKRRGAVQAFEVTLINKAGDKFQCWLTSNARYDRSGKITGYQGIIHDISEKLQLEQERDRFFTQTKELICIMSPDGTYKRINPAFTKTLDCDPQEVLASNFIQLIREDERDVVKHLLASLAEGADRTIFEGHIRCKDGSYRLVEWRVSPDPVSELYYAVGSDITEQKRNEDLQRERDLAARSAEIKANFLANMSHEIRTPLNAVTGMTHLLRQTDLDPKQLEYLLALESSSELLMQLINDILDISKMEAGKMSLEEREFSLKDLVETLTQSMKFRAVGKNLELSTVFGENIPESFVGDGFRLNQILMNLVGNAIKFTDDGSVEIRVDCESVQEDKVMMRFAVKDTGIGIENDRIESIFESFNQANAEVTRKYGGTGLGLAIVKRLVNMMEGVIDVNSTPGEGTLFQVILPMRQASGTSNHASSELHEQMLPDLSDKNILLVEDHEVNQLVVSEMIKYQWPGISLHICHNGKEALEVTSRQAFDLVIMDVMMPEMDGYSCTRQLRKQPNTSKLPVLALSALTGENEKRKCREAGMSDYLSKPVDPHQLFKKMVKLCSPGSSAMTVEGTPVVQTELHISVSADLGYLEKITNGNKNLMSRTLTIIRDESPEALELLRAAGRASDGKRIAAIAHKLRASMQFVNNTELVEQLKKLEDKCRLNGTDVDQAEVEQLADSCQSSIELIEELITNLNT